MTPRQETPSPISVTQRRVPEQTLAKYGEMFPSGAQADADGDITTVAANRASGNIRRRWGAQPANDQGDHTH